MTNYVNVPFLKIRNFVLALADYDFDDSLLKPFRLTLEPIDFFCQRLSFFTSSKQFRFFQPNVRLRLQKFSLSERHNAFVHAPTGYLVDANEH